MQQRVWRPDVEEPFGRGLHARQHRACPLQRLYAPAAGQTSQVLQTAWLRGQFRPLPRKTVVPLSRQPVGQLVTEGVPMEIGEAEHGLLDGRACPGRHAGGADVFEQQDVPLRCAETAMKGGRPGANPRFEIAIGALLVFERAVHELIGRGVGALEEKPRTPVEEEAKGWRRSVAAPDARGASDAATGQLLDLATDSRRDATPRRLGFRSEPGRHQRPRLTVGRNYGMSIVGISIDGMSMAAGCALCSTVDARVPHAEGARWIALPDPGMQ